MAKRTSASRAVDVLDAFYDVFTEIGTKDSLSYSAVCADASRELFASLKTQQEPASPPSNNSASTDDGYSELTALRTRISELEAGGCARDQGTTQYCAEAVALQKRVSELERLAAFFAFCIKSGEPWTETCDRMYAALKKEPGNDAG